MLNSDEIAALITRLRSKCIKELEVAFTAKEMEQFANDEQWFVEDLKHSGVCVASDRFSVDQIDAMAQYFDIDYQTLRHLDIGDAFCLFNEWVAYLPQEKAAELFPLDFLLYCEIEAGERLMRKVGFKEFWRLKLEAHEKRRAAKRQGTKLSVSLPSSRHI